MAKATRISCGGPQAKTNKTWLVLVRPEADAATEKKHHSLTAGVEHRVCRLPRPANSGPATDVLLVTAPSSGRPWLGTEKRGETAAVGVVKAMADGLGPSCRLEVGDGVRLGEFVVEEVDCGCLDEDPRAAVVGFGGVSALPGTLAPSRGPKLNANGKEERATMLGPAACNEVTAFPKAR